MAHSMLAWPHSGFHVHDGVWVAADDREFAVWPGTARICGIRGRRMGSWRSHRLVPMDLAISSDYLKGRVIPRKSLHSNKLRHLSRKTVTNSLSSGLFGVRVVAALAIGPRAKPHRILNPRPLPD